MTARRADTSSRTRARLKHGHRSPGESGSFGGARRRRARAPRRSQAREGRARVRVCPARRSRGACRNARRFRRVRPRAHLFLPFPPPLAGQTRASQGALRQGGRREPRHVPDGPPDRARRRPLLAPRRRAQGSRDHPPPRGGERAHPRAPRTRPTPRQSRVRRDREEHPGVRRRHRLPLGRIRVLRPDRQGKGVSRRVPQATSRGSRAKEGQRGGGPGRQRGGETFEILFPGRLQTQSEPRHTRVQRGSERIRDVRDPFQKSPNGRGPPGRRERHGGRGVLGLR